jgi:hypothetical protein
VRLLACGFRDRAGAVKLLGLVLIVGIASAQTFSGRGYLETRGWFYPQTAPGDSGHAVGESIFSYDANYRADSNWSFAAGVVAQTDTHRGTERAWHLSWLDRELKRPAFAVRRFTASYHKGLVSLEAGRQLIRWGKADILNPTDRFGARDFLNVVHSEFLPVVGARLTIGGQTNTLELVAVPLFTPTRMPLLNQRWSGLPAGIPIVDLGARFPGGTQFAGRWNHIGKAAEFSLSYFDGFNHQPMVDVRVLPGAFPTVPVQRYYPRLRSYGGDIAVPFRWLTLKSEAAYFDSRDRTADQYGIYVIQLERQSGEWSFIGGYAGQVVTRATPVPAFDYERGLTRSFLGRAGYTLATNRDLAVDGILRQNGKGFLARAEFSQAFQQHWRVTVGFAYLHGSEGDFLGQFNRNSYLTLALRYSL